MASVARVGPGLVPAGSWCWGVVCDAALLRQWVCSSVSHFVILREFVRTLRELPLDPNGTKLGAKSENGARHECIIYDGTAGAI